MKKNKEEMSLTECFVRLYYFAKIISDSQTELKSSKRKFFAKRKTKANKKLEEKEM